MVQHAIDALHAAGSVGDVAGQELKDLHDVRGILLGQCGGDAAAHKDPEGLLDKKRLERRLLVAVKALLLEEGQQACHQVQVLMIALGGLVQVQDLVVLAEAIAVEVAVRVVEQRVLRVQVRQYGVALHGLPECGRVLERKALLAQRVAEAHPGPVAAAGRSTVPFVHQHEVVAFEGVHRHGLVTHLVAQPGDFNDLHCLPGEQTAPVLVEQLGLDARRLELAQMLLGQALVRREQDDAVEFSPPAVLGQVVLELQDVGVHHQGLATARGHPEGQLVQLLPGLACRIQGCDLVRLGLVHVPGCHLLVQPCQQGLRIPEVPVEIDLGEQQGQVLEVLPHHGLVAARKAPLVEPLRVPDDVLVVLQQQFCRQLRQVEELRRQGMVEAVGVVLVQTYQCLVAQQLGQVFEALRVEQRQQPVIEHQLVGKRRHRLLFRRGL